ncbi:Putative NADH-flavin reductase [Asanoa ishikariensis]|uniref:Putative NADH-flavin reductase n=1 Tax=Asanoa ishikariensis TaxID=137265 RepID=A0A1H3TDY6_9ACTN|nr:NAD(P)H-binding protein [Asanoa ishikariensis]SDZ48310.1 Putative NADH-flavin reductase [Asanoa ishikariensis]
MRIVIAGGHGQVARLLNRRLADAGHTPVAIFRDAAQTADVVASGAEPVVLDLEKSSPDAVAAALRGADAVVFAAGAGPGSGPARKKTVDRDAAILLADAATAAGVRRYVLLSAIGADDFDPALDDDFEVYLEAKSAADADLRLRDLDWTILRPDGFTDKPGTGKVTVAETVGRASIPRADVAAVIAAVVTGNLAVHRQFEVTAGDNPIEAAIAAL